MTQHTNGRCGRANVCSKMIAKKQSRWWSQVHTKSRKLEPKHRRGLRLDQSPQTASKGLLTKKVGFGRETIEKTECNAKEQNFVIVSVVVIGPPAITQACRGQVGISTGQVAGKPSIVTTRSLRGSSSRPSSRTGPICDVIGQVWRHQRMVNKDSWICSQLNWGGATEDHPALPNQNKLNRLYLAKLTSSSGQRIVSLHIKKNRIFCWTSWSYDIVHL